MTGLEELGWYARVVFAQLIGPLVWFLLARDRYESPSGLSARARLPLTSERGIR